LKRAVIFSIDFAAVNLPWAWRVVIPVLIIAGGISVAADTTLGMNTSPREASSSNKFVNASAITANLNDGIGAIDSTDRQVVDARNIGVDCTGTNDSAAALNALSGSGGLTGIKLVFPAGTRNGPCLIKLGSTWNIYNSTSFTIDGGARCGLPGNCTHFKYTGSTGGAVVDMERVFGFEVKNILVDGNGTAATGVIVDQNLPGGIATYDGIFEGVLFNANASNRPGPAAGWVGLSVSPVSRANVADIRVIDSAFECVSTGSASGTIGYGLGLTNGSQNALIEVIRHNYFEHCGYGIYQRNGGAIIEENTFGGDASTIDDIYLMGTSAHERIVANWSESQQGHSNQFFKAAFQDVTGPGIEISGNQIPINAGCALDIGGNTITSREPNVWYKGAAGQGRDSAKACATSGGYNFTWSGPSGLSWPEDVIGTLTAGVFLPGSLKNGPSAGMIANSAATIAQGVPVKWSGAATVVGTTAADTGAGVVVGVAANAPGASGRPTYVMTSGYIVMAADDGCSVGQFVIVSRRNAGRVQCTSTYVAGTVIGVALLGKKDGGVHVQVGLR
jgi:hypothetical protein